MQRLSREGTLDTKCGVGIRMDAHPCKHPSINNPLVLGATYEKRSHDETSFEKLRYEAFAQKKGRTIVRRLPDEAVEACNVETIGNYVEG